MSAAKIQDYQEILRVAHLYVDDCAKGDGAMIQPAFHENAATDGIRWPAFSTDRVKIPPLPPIICNDACTHEFSFRARLFLGPDLVQEVFHFDPTHSSNGRQLALARQQEFGRFYNSFLEVSSQLEQPQTRQAALDTMRRLAKAGFRTAMGRVMDVVLHDPTYFNLKEAVELLASRDDLLRDEAAQLTLLRELQQKDAAAHDGAGSCRPRPQTGPDPLV